MAKILLFIFFLHLVSNVSVQATPIDVDDNEDPLAALARLHQEVDKIRRRLNPVPDLITFASNDIADRLHHNIRTKQYEEEETGTVYVDMNIGSEEILETKYVNLYIDTGRNINTKSTRSTKLSDYTDTKVVFVNDESADNEKSNLPYSRYSRRHRRQSN